LRVRIHRGAKEIGGSCIEVEASGQRIVLDVGRPLDAEFGDVVPLPDVPGLTEGTDPSLLGLLISHGHQDHWGLVGQVSKDVPIYMGKGAASLLRAAEFFSPAGVDLSLAGHFVHRESFELGPFTLTPYLNDHNGFDTYSVLIEADGRRLFYSADFQGHGRKRGIFQQMLRKPPEGVNVMLMEGTNVRTDAEPAHEMTELEVEEALVPIFKATTGMPLVSYSSQNIDRLVSIYNASLRADRILVVDLYTAAMATATEKDTIPQPGWPNLLVYVPERQRRRIVQAKAFERLNPTKGCRIYRASLAERRHEMVMTFRGNMAQELERDGCLKGASAVWSMWPGYLEQGEDRYKEMLKQLDIPLEIIHASGHAHLKDLKKFSKAISPQRLVPIHSFAPERFTEHFDNVEQHADGEWWEV
jgi:ribonuclease J